MLKKIHLYLIFRNLNILKKSNSSILLISDAKLRDLKHNYKITFKVKTTGIFSTNIFIFYKNWDWIFFILKMHKVYWQSSSCIMQSSICYFKIFFLSSMPIIEATLSLIIAMMFLTKAAMSLLSRNLVSPLIRDYEI